MGRTVPRAADLLEVMLKKAGVAQERINPRLLNEMLTIGTRKTQMDILSLAKANNKAFDMLVDFAASTDVGVETDGYALSGLDSTTGPLLCGMDAVIRAECTLSSVQQRCLIRSTENEVLSQNYYYQGNNEWPILYMEAGSLYIDVTTGSYPVTVTLNYIRDAKTLVTTDASTDIADYQTDRLEFDEGLEDLAIRNSYAECMRTFSGEERYKSIREDIMNDLSGLMNISLVASNKGKMEE